MSLIKIPCDMNSPMKILDFAVIYDNMYACLPKTGISCPDAIQKIMNDLKFEKDSQLNLKKSKYWRLFLWKNISNYSI